MGAATDITRVISVRRKIPEGGRRVAAATRTILIARG